MAAGTARDMGRLIVDAQLEATERWGGVADRYSRDLRRLATGEIDSLEFGKGMLDLAMTETLRATEGVARFGLGYYRWLAGVAGVDNAQ